MSSITLPEDLGTLQKVRSNNFRWILPLAYQEVLLGPDGLRIGEWLESEQAKVVKKGPHRIVYQVKLPQLEFYIKHNLIPDKKTWLRQLIRPSKARMEYNKALAVAARGIPTIEPLAIGEQNGTAFGIGESFLLTRSLDETAQLNHYLEENTHYLRGNQPFRAKLAESLGKFLARLHDAGVHHHDLHCGNILIQFDETNQPKFFLIDLQAVRLNPPLSWKKSKENLAMLNRWLSLRASRTDRLHFWQAYFQARNSEVWQLQLAQWKREGELIPGKRVCAPGIACDLERETRESNRRFWNDRDHRWLQSNRHNRRIRTRELVGFVVSDFDQLALKKLLENPDAPFQDPQAKFLKNSRSAKVVEFTSVVGGELRQVIYKKFEVTDCYDPMINRLRCSPTMRSWIFGHCLRERGLPTPRPLAVFHRRHWGLLHEGYLLMDKVDSQGDLHQSFTAIAKLNPDSYRPIIWKNIEQLAILIRELHARFLAHRDLKAPNLLVKVFPKHEECADREFILTSACPNPYSFIDLVGITREHHLGKKLRIKNLARLNASFWNQPLISRTDKLRFLRTYLQWGILGKESWKEYWRAIEKATLAKVEKNRRNGRPLA